MDPKSWGYEKQFEFEKNLSLKFSLSLNTNVGSKNHWPKKFWSKNIFSSKKFGLKKFGLKKIWVLKKRDEPKSRLGNNSQLSWSLPRKSGNFCRKYVIYADKMQNIKRKCIEINSSNRNSRKGGTYFVISHIKLTQ